MKEKLTAVALSYPAGAELPFVAAKSKGALAERLIKIAEENNIPVVQDEFAAGILSAKEIGESIPENTWEIIAKIFAVIVESEKKL